MKENETKAFQVNGGKQQKSKSQQSEIKCKEMFQNWWFI